MKINLGKCFFYINNVGMVTVFGEGGRDFVSSLLGGSVGMVRLESGTYGFSFYICFSFLCQIILLSDFCSTLSIKA